MRRLAFSQRLLLRGLLVGRDSPEVAKSRYASCESRALVLECCYDPTATITVTTAL